ncbi:MAG: hypothetical protein PWQ57_1239 [Desulfovibrionales bacterium]|jgi:nucleoside-diphosphate-sugar epimerase|nr:hypothetical protein [Desulfovibrionales bacterium]
MSKVVFITGGAGFVGSRAARCFIKRNDEVYIFNTFEQRPIPDPEATPRNLLGYKPEYDLERGVSLYVDHLRNHPI